MIKFQDLLETFISLKKLNNNLKDKFRGAVLGSIIGDAWGANYEGMSHKSIKKINEFTETSGCYTDDSEMMKGVLESILENNGNFNGQHMAERFVNNFNYYRGYGMSTISVLMKIKDGQPWNHPAKNAFYGNGSYGNGAAMRICPVGLLYYSNLDILQNITKNISSITHTHPLGIEGAILQAYAVALAVKSNLANFNSDEFIVELKSLSISSIYQEKLSKILTFLKSNPPIDIYVAELGVNITAHGSVPMAIWNFVKSPNNFQKIIQSSIMCGGDTDTIACMAGGIAGAFLGLDYIPSVWINHVENSDLFIKLADELFNLFQKKQIR
jgi:poly(ADP-ribose) glycohydrolase ARH3